MCRTGRRLGKRERDGTIRHRPGIDVTLCAPKSVSLAALVGGDRRIVRAHDRAVKRTLSWIEKRAIETRVQNLVPRTMVGAGNQKALYVAINRARYRAELITDDGRKLSDHLERASGERVSVLDAAADTAAVKVIFRDAGDGRIWRR